MAKRMQPTKGMTGAVKAPTRPVASAGGFKGKRPMRRPLSARRI